MSLLNYYLTRVFSIQTLSLIIILSTSRGVQAQDDYLRLLNKPTRPTVKEVTDFQIPSERGIPLPAQNRLDFLHWSDVLIDHAPTLIAQLEKAVPGATWAFLGRDSDAIADIVEAFYQSIGQTDRVVRIGMSKTTLWENGNGAQIATKEDIVEFIKSYGFDLASFRQSHPFIIVDTLSRGGGTQGRVVIDALYSVYEDQGGNAADLVRYFNMIGLATSTYQGFINSFDDAESIFTANENNYRQRDNHGHSVFRTDFFSEHKILMIPHAPNDAHESGYEHFVGAWHERYGPLRYDENNQLRAIITNGPFNIRIRKSILWMMRRSILAAHDLRFLAQVEGKALKLGYTFPKTRPGLVVTSKSDAELLAEKMKETDVKIASAGPIRTREILDEIYANGVQQNQPGLSASGQLALEWLKQARRQFEPNALGIAFLRILSSARVGSYVTARDLRILVREVFEMSEISNVLIVEVEKLVEIDKAFQALMLDEEWIVDGPGLETLSNVRAILRDRLTCSESFLQ